MEILHTTPVIYEFKDLNDEEITGRVYETELEETRQKMHRIEKVLQRRGKKVLVKWKGYPDKFNSLVDSDQIKLR